MIDFVSETLSYITELLEIVKIVSVSTGVLCGDIHFSVFNINLRL